MTLSVAGREHAGIEDARAAVQTRDLVVRYGRKKAVDGLNLTVPRGSVYGFLGPNGAGGH
jgi:ABC-2 type transport system ATP-binding protein